MKNKKIIIPAMLLALTAASISPFISAQAASANTNATGTSTVQKLKNFIGHKGVINKSKTAPTAAQTAAMAAAKAAMTAKVTAVTTALQNSDYTAWVTAMNALNVPNPNVKAKVNANANATAKVKPVPLTSKITAANFPQLVEAYNLEVQLQAKLTALGINQNDGRGMIQGLGMGFGMGLGR